MPKKTMLQVVLMSRRYISNTSYLRRNFTEKITKRLKRFESETSLKNNSAASASFSYEVDSILAEKFIKKNLEKFESIKKRKEVDEERKQSEEEMPEKSSFPFAFKRDPGLFKSTIIATSSNDDGNHQNVEPPEELVDRGFFFEENEFADEYIAATTADLPEEEMTEPLYDYYNTEDAVEQIEVLRPGHQHELKSVSRGELENLEGKEWYNEDETEDTSIEPSTSASCLGCGAKFHCQDSALPGFVPVQMFKKILNQESRKRQVVTELCRRCYVLKNYDFLLNVNVAEVDYQKLMGHLKLLQEALIILVVDMTDIHGSIYKALPQIIGDRKPMIVVGNKVDLLPPDYYAGYMRNWNETLRSALKASGLADRFNILNTSLVSAKTGYGVEDLITKIYTKWLDQRGNLRSDIYLIGCTNAGKSTLFNTFLQSDLCKVKAMDVVERVTTSIWPGTTLSLLKFPLMNPTSQRLEERKQRLEELSTWMKRESDLRRTFYYNTKNPKYLTLFGLVENTFKESDEENKALTKEEKESIFSPDLTFQEEPKEKKTKRRTLEHPMFTKGHWCYDTPGTVNESQLLSIFTLEELINVIPRKMIAPRSYIINSKESLLIGGVARIDLLTTEKAVLPVFLTIFASDRLPIQVLPTSDVADFLNRYNGTALVGAPLGGPDRLKLFPKLIGGEFEISGLNEIEGCADIVLSSIGWVCVTSWNTKMQFRISTPGGKGIFIRQPPLVKYAINFRGARIPGKAEYESKPLKTLPSAIKPKEFVPQDPTFVKKKKLKYREEEKARGENEKPNTSQER